MFHTVHIKEEHEQNGYGEWLKSKKDIYDTDDLETLKQTIKDTQLQTSSSIENIQSTNNSGCYHYSHQSYQSDPFSKLKYDDLKKAHTETIVPVTMDDYHNVKKYKNVNELKQTRESIEPPHSLQQSEQFLKQQSLQNTEDACSTAFQLMKHQEETHKRQNKWWAKFKQIKNL